MMLGNIRRKQRGITLLELLIVMVIIGIMAAIAYPNYRNYVERAKRNEAKAALLLIAQNQERFYLQNNTYTTDMTRLGFAAAANNITDSGTYRVNVPAADANNFTATATYLPGGNEATKCPTFVIDGRGGKSSPDGAYADCWTRTR